MIEVPHHPLPNRLVLVVHNLAAGGVQRVVSEMADAWQQRGRQVCVVTLSGTRDDYFRLSEQVERIPLDVMSDSSSFLAALFNSLRRLRKLRRAIVAAKPHCVVSFMDRTNVLALLATRGLRVPVIVCERTNPELHPIGPIWDRVRRWIYPAAETLVVQTKQAHHFFRSFVPESRLTVIPNFVRSIEASEQAERPPVILGMGRLSYEKGFDQLIDAWGKIATDHPDWVLRVYGDGPERDALESQICETAPNRVELAGWAPVADAAYSEASIFVLPSRYEGFPNALLEAMATGLAVVSFDCPSGPGEIVRHEVDGLLVTANDVPALAATIEQLITDPSLRGRLGEAAREVTKRFSIETHFGEWESLLSRVAGST